MVSKRLVLRFPPRLVGEPIVCRLVRERDLAFNILKASVTPEEAGLLVLEITGDEAACRDGVDYLTHSGVDVTPLREDVVRDEDRCTHCGACTAVCPSDALALDLLTSTIMGKSV